MLESTSQSDTEMVLILSMYVICKFELTCI